MPKPWGDMSREEKGALLLAHHEGKPIECWREDLGWQDMLWPLWYADFSYRIRPEPKRDTVKIYAACPATGVWEQWPDDDDTHRIAFDLIDGEPDCASVKMERIND